MTKPSTYIHNAIAQLFDEIEEKCKVKFATFTASETQGQENIAAGERKYMGDTFNNKSNGIYKYLYDPGMAFDFRFHQRLASAPFKKTNVPWATIMFSTKQVRPLTNVLSHKYIYTHYHEGTPYQIKTRRVSVPVNMAIISNDMDKLYETTEKIAMYFDRFINFHYDHVFTIRNLKDGGFNIYESVVGHAANIREIDLDKLDTTNRGSIVSQAYQFDLVYWIVEAPDTSLHTLKRVILQIAVGKDYRDILVVFDNTEGDNFRVKEFPESETSELDVTVKPHENLFTVVREDDVADVWVEPPKY